MKLQKNTLVDETSIVKLGFDNELDFHQMTINLPQPSMWTNFPTAEKPLALYKYSSLNLYMSQDTKIFNRETYGFLDFLGDLGGLNDSLTVILSRIVNPIAGFALHASLLTSLFRWQPRHLERSQGRN